MTLYYAQKGKTGFYIQPDMMMEFKKMGYTILKYEPVEVKDVKAEMELVTEGAGEDNGES